MANLFPKNVTPQRQYLIRRFASFVRSRSLRSADVQAIFVHFRETENDETFKEWGSSVAHVRRDQGLVWKSAAAIWATHTYYSNLNPEEVSINALPSDIFFTIRQHLEHLSDFEIRTEFRDIFPSGISRAELLATLDHMYCVSAFEAGRKGRPHVRDAFFHLYQKSGIDPRDRAWITRLVIDLEDAAINVPPMQLSEIVCALEQAVRRNCPELPAFTIAERKFLQLHCLVAFHDTVLELKQSALKEITGIDSSAVQPMLFVSSFEQNLTLDLGFFILEDGKYIEPEALRSPIKNLVGGRIERYYYPLLESNLPATDYLHELDENIRLTLYNHPLDVIRHKGKHVIIAEERALTRYPTSKTREG
jgi:hypothetical protein